MSTLALFDEGPRVIADGAAWLPGFAVAEALALIDGVAQIVSVAPFRHLETPGGQRMSVAMSNCGVLGWVSDQRGYRYDSLDALSGRPWPAMPPLFSQLAIRAAAVTGYPNFAPDACLINRYLPRARMGLHQDRDEQDFTQPIVSVSLGLDATFQWGGLKRTDPVQRLPLVHGDVVVWGGPSRLRFHGVLPLKDGHHPQLGAQRINLTFRRAR